MDKLSNIQRLIDQARRIHLDNHTIISKYTLPELASIYNGIGPDAFPAWLRGCISALHPALAVAALIHDIEWHEADGSEEAFRASNARFRRNGMAAAKDRFGWWNPMRYVVMAQARRFGDLCQIFGWKAWESPCGCVLCHGPSGQDTKK